MDQGLPKRLRLLSRREFRRTFQQGITVQERLLRIRAARSPLPWPRLGMAVSRRAGNAVRRNRIRRLYREAFRLERAQLPPLDLVLMPRRGAALPTLPALREELVRLAQKAACRLPAPASSSDGTPCGSSASD